MYWCLFFFCVLNYFNLFSSTSFVYNFRVAEITKNPNPISSWKNKDYLFNVDKNNEFLLDKSERISGLKRNKNFVGLIFDEYEKTYNKFIYNYSGLFESFIYNSKIYFFRSDFAFANIIEKINHKLLYKGNEPDDILLTFARKFKINKSSGLNLSGLLGIPVKKSLILKHPDFGYGQVSLGIQLDGFYDLNPRNGLAYGIRYIYFIPRNIYNNDNKRYKFTIGNLADFLFAYQYEIKLNHGIEFGYNFESKFGTSIYPHVADIVRQNIYNINSFYCVYKYKFLIKYISNTLFVNISYSFDMFPNRFSIKYLIIAFIAWNVNF